MNEIERRFFETGPLEVQQAAVEGLITLRGYAAKFNALSEVMGGFREQIAPSAFDNVLQDDVRALFNHDPNQVLGRISAGTLRIRQDAAGLWYEVDLPDTQAARDLRISIERGDVSQSSFAFRVAAKGDDWEEDRNGVIVRTISKVARLFDVSPVTYPAYPDATVGFRSLQAWQQNREALGALARRGQQQAEVRRRWLRMNVPTLLI